MNKVILDLCSKTEIKVTDKQIGVLIDKFQKISYLSSKLDNAGLSISPNVLAWTLLEREGVDSSVIEGTQTNFEEIYFDFKDGINDKYAWEVRNLINLYKSSFRDFNDEIIDYTIDDLKQMHRDLYRREIDEYKNNYDPIEVIKSVKPGTIISDPEKPNWIGKPGSTVETSLLVLIAPEEKERYLEDLFKEIREAKGTRSVSALIKFHVFFESIHPFADGNGRIGRMLLVNLFKYLGFTKYNWIFVSDYWRINKKMYMQQLFHVQTTNDWNDWVYFFVDTIIHSVDNAYNKINGILDLYKSIIANHKLNSLELKLLKHFFKYPMLSKTLTIKWLKESVGANNAAAYRAFEKVVKITESSGINEIQFDNLFNIINK